MAPKIKMLAVKAFSYAGQRLKAGGQFEASKQDARALAAVGIATADTGSPKRARKTAVKPNAEEVAEAAAAPAAEAEADVTTAESNNVGAVTQGTYLTRDMTAE